MKEFDGKNVVITGANRGIGRAIAEKYMENGAALFAVVRDTEKFSETKQTLEKNIKEKLSRYSVSSAMKVL